MIIDLNYKIMNDEDLTLEIPNGQNSQGVDSETISDDEEPLINISSSNYCIVKNE